MEKIVFADKTEIEIREGASLGAVTAVVNDFAALQGVADALTKKGNLDTVEFKTDDQVTGKYEGMKLESPLFRAVDTKEEKVHATFGIREKTELEKRMDAIEKRQDKTDTQQSVQDGAILDLAGMVAGGEK